MNTYFSLEPCKYKKADIYVYVCFYVTVGELLILVQTYRSSETRRYGYIVALNSHKAMS